MFLRLIIHVGQSVNDRYSYYRVQKSGTLDKAVPNMHWVEEGYRGSTETGRKIRASTVLDQATVPRIHIENRTLQ